MGPVMLIALQTILACLVSVGYVPFVFLVGFLEGATLCCDVVVHFVVSIVWVNDDVPLPKALVCSCF